jgi:hypothetical protein
MQAQHSVLCNVATPLSVQSLFHSFATLWRAARVWNITGPTNIGIIYRTQTKAFTKNNSKMIYRVTFDCNTFAFRERHTREMWNSHVYDTWKLHTQRTQYSEQCR